jgi:hypothetical protein
LAVCAEAARTHAIRMQSRKKTLNGLRYFILEPTVPLPVAKRIRGRSRGDLLSNPLHKKHGEAFSKLRFPWKRGTNEETPGRGFQPTLGEPKTHDASAMPEFNRRRRDGGIFSTRPWVETHGYIQIAASAAERLSCYERTIS